MSTLCEIKSIFHQLIKVYIWQKMLYLNVTGTDLSKWVKGLEQKLIDSIIFVVL